MAPASAVTDLEDDIMPDDVSPPTVFLSTTTAGWRSCAGADPVLAQAGLRSTGP